MHKGITLLALSCVLACSGSSPAPPATHSTKSADTTGDDTSASGGDDNSGNGTSGGDDGSGNGGDDQSANSGGDDSASAGGWGTCEAVPIADPPDVYCQITSYCGILGGTATLTSGPMDNPPCTCECK